MQVLKYNETFYVVYQSKSIIKKVIESQTVQAERKKNTLKDKPPHLET